MLIAFLRAPGAPSGKETTIESLHAAREGSNVAKVRMGAGAAGAVRRAALAQDVIGEAAVVLVLSAARDVNSSRGFFGQRIMDRRRN
jgi:hypothetical protein